MPNRILILFAHPLFEKSRIHKSLVNHIPEGVTFHDLYEEYPEFNIDIDREKDLLLSHDLIIWQHPFYWYSCPAMLKQWIDMVLEVGWAYGPGGNALQGKSVLQVISTGGARTAYQSEGYHHNTIYEFLAPFVRTTQLCRMKYFPPYVVHGSNRASEDEIVAAGQNYALILDYFKQTEPEFEALKNYLYLNDWLNENGTV